MVGLNDGFMVGRAVGGRSLPTAAADAGFVRMSSFRLM